MLPWVSWCEENGWYLNEIEIHKLQFVLRCCFMWKKWKSNHIVTWKVEYFVQVSSCVHFKVIDAFLHLLLSRLYMAKICLGRLLRSRNSILNTSKMTGRFKFTDIMRGVTINPKRSLVAAWEDVASISHILLSPCTVVNPKENDLMLVVQKINYWKV